MRKLQLSQLSDAARSFLAEAQEGELLVIQDEVGRSRYAVVPFRPTTVQAQAWAKIEALQQGVARSMQERGISEADVDRLLIEGT